VPAPNASIGAPPVSGRAVTPATGVLYCSAAVPYGFSTERNAVVTFQELDAAWREEVALRKPELSERYAEVREAIVA